MVKTMDRVQGSRGQHAMADRIKKSLYYGRTKEAKEVMECPSLPLTEAVVDVFGKALKKSFPENRSLDVFDLNYASNVSEKACISPCSVVLSTIYLDKLKKKNSDYLRTVSPCDVFLVSMMVASKYLFDDGEDEEVFNDEWAASGEIELKELNRKEREFLTAMEWELYVSPDEFFKQLQNLELLVTWNETRRRKFDGLTYNELVSLAFDKNSILKWAQCADGFLKMFAITAITYGAVITSVLGATMI
ncbi:Protein CNPPD1 [Halotydeus destructor]|nr:Protein CNPPD1 [Halotydeus destructor]